MVIEETHQTVTTIIENKTENINMTQVKSSDNNQPIENTNKNIGIVEEIHDTKEMNNIMEKDKNEINQINEKDIPKEINKIPQPKIIIESKEIIKEPNINNQKKEINNIPINEPIIPNKIQNEHPIEIHEDIPEAPGAIKDRSVSKERVIPVDIVETIKSKGINITTPVDLIEEEPVKKINIEDILKEKKKEVDEEKLIPLELLEPQERKEMKEKMIPLDIKEKEKKMEIERIIKNERKEINIPIPQKVNQKEKELALKIEELQKKNLIPLELLNEAKKEKIIPLENKENKIPNTNIISSEINKAPLKEKEIPLQMKESPKEKVATLDIRGIIKNSEIPSKIREAYNKMLEHPKKKVENELITEILEGKKIDNKMEKVEKVERERKDNRNVNNLINQILQEKTVVYPNKVNTNIIKEERREKRDKRVNRNEQILDILQGKLINIPSDNNEETIYEDRGDNIFKKKIGSNVQRLFDRKVTNNNNFNNTNNYNTNMNLIENNNRYLNIPGNYPKVDIPRMNYSRAYPNIQSMLEINRQPENQMENNGNIVIEKMDKVEIVEDTEEKFPKNLQITEYPRRTIRKEQKRTEIDLIDPNNKKEEIHIMDTVNRNINLFPHMQTQPIISIPQNNIEVEKNEEKVQKKDEYDFLKQFGKQKDDNSKELLDLIQTVIEDDPNQIKMFQQKIKDDEIKSGF